MIFYNNAVGVWLAFFISLGADFGIRSENNLLENCGNDNLGVKSQGMKQLIAGGDVTLTDASVAFSDITLVPQLAPLFG